MRLAHPVLGGNGQKPPGRRSGLLPSRLTPQDHAEQPLNPNCSTHSVEPWANAATPVSLHKEGNNIQFGPNIYLRESLSIINAGRGHGRVSPRLAVLTSPAAISGPKHRFTNSMGYPQPIQQQTLLPGQWPRKSLRVTLDAEVSFRRSGKLTYKVRVFDASRHGCKVEFIERPTLSERAWIKFDGLEPLEAMVCWVNGFATGVRFEKPIHPAVFDGLVARLQERRTNNRR